MISRVAIYLVSVPRKFQFTQLFEPGLDYHDLNSTINIRKEDSAKLIGELKQLRKLQDQRRKQQQHNV